MLLRFFHKNHVMDFYLFSVVTFSLTSSAISLSQRKGAAHRVLCPPSLTQSFRWPRLTVQFPCAVFTVSSIVSLQTIIFNGVFSLLPAFVF